MLKLILAATVAALCVTGAYAQTPAPALDDEGYPAVDAPVKIARLAQSGVTQKVGVFFFVDAACMSLGTPKIKIVKDVDNGTLSNFEEQNYPNFAAPNPRVKCNTKKIESEVLTYRSEKGFTGADYFSVVLVYPNGTVNAYDYKVIVK